MSDLEDRVMKSNQAEQVREKSLCKIRIGLGDSVTPLSVKTFALQDSRRRREKRGHNIYLKK